MHRSVLFSCLGPLTCLALAACGGSDTPGAKAAHERHEHFEALGKAMKGLSDELKQASPNVSTVKEDAGAMSTAASQLKTWFPAGSGPQDGVKTHALDTVWTHSDEFGAAAAKLTDATSALNSAAQAGDLAAVRGAVGTVGGACKGCHDKFRRKE